MRSLTCRRSYPAFAGKTKDSVWYEVFRRDSVLGAGLAEQYTNKTFYSVGLLLHPNSGEPLEAVAGADWVFEPGMTFHTYLLNRGFGMSETIVITEAGYERLTDFPRQLFIAE